MLSSKFNVWPITPFQVVRFEKNPSQTGIVFSNHFEYQQPYVFIKIVFLSHNTILSGQNWNISSQSRVIFPDDILNITSLLSSILNVLSHNSIPTGQIWKIPSQTGVIFPDDQFEYQQLYVIFQIEHFDP